MYDFKHTYAYIIIYIIPTKYDILYVKAVMNLLLSL
jgi:hypothetical protein